jgi:hypothetical protein
MTDNTENDEVVTLIETDEPKKVKKKRTYEEQKERIKAYIKNRYANDAEFRNKMNNKRTINNTLKYNTDEEYRLKKLEYMRNNRKNKKNTEQDNKDNLEDDIKKLDDIFKNMSIGNIKLDDVNTAKILYDKIIKQNPDYKKMI